MMLRVLCVAAVLALGVAPARATEAVPVPGVAAMLAPAAPIETVSVALTRHDAGTFYVAGRLQGYGDLTMLLDTGSSFLVINESILNVLMEAGNASYLRQLDGRMADGSRRIIPVYQVSSLRLGADCWVHDVEAAVFPAEARPILGMNILARLAPFTFTADPAPALAVNRCASALTTASGGASSMPAALAP